MHETKSSNEASGWLKKRIKIMVDTFYRTGLLGEHNIGRNDIELHVRKAPTQRLHGTEKSWKQNRFDVIVVSRGPVPVEWIFMLIFHKKEA